MKNSSTIIHKSLYKKHDSPNASCNQSSFFQDGYKYGSDEMPKEWISKKWAKWEGSDDEWREWKRGVWAARLQKLNVNLKR